MGAPPKYRAASCSSCGAAIIWARTEAGRPMPVDAKPEKRVSLVGVEGAEPTAMVVDSYVSHFATCAQADQHRKPRAAAKCGKATGPEHDAGAFGPPCALPAGHDGACAAIGEQCTSVDGQTGARCGNRLGHDGLHQARKVRGVEYRVPISWREPGAP